MPSVRKSGTELPLDEEIIYEVKGGQLVDVFNITQKLVSHETREYLKRRDHNYGEFGGSIEFCSDEIYYCLRGGISVVIPKDIEGKKSWQYLDIKCEALHAAYHGYADEVTCWRWNLSVTFSYTVEKGILSYRTSWSPELTYVLIGEKGLFAK
jgi:hypothetical protein